VGSPFSLYLKKGEEDEVRNPYGNAQNFPLWHPTLPRFTIWSDNDIDSSLQLIICGFFDDSIPTFDASISSIISIRSSKSSAFKKREKGFGSRI
jgi:hypothetical protein